MSEKPDKHMLKQQQDKQKQLNNIPKIIEITDEVENLNELIQSVIIEAKDIKKLTQNMDIDIAIVIDTELDSHFVKPLEKMIESNNKEIIMTWNDYITTTRE